MSKRRSLFLISLAALVVVGGLFAHRARQRCPVPLTSAPTSWTDLHALARTYAAQAGPGYRIDTLHAEGPLSTVGGPVPIRVAMRFVAPEPARPTERQPWYAVRTLTVVEGGSCGQWQDVRAATSDRPSLESQQRFDRVRLGPRDIYQLTWQQAQHDLARSSQIHWQMSLYVADELTQGTGPEWAISYFGDRSMASYTIDAQTGTQIDRRIWP